MKLKELLTIVDREKVFEIAFTNMQKDILFDHKKVDKEKTKLRYFDIIDEIESMRNRKTAEGSLVVVKTKDSDDSERFDAFLVKPNDNEHYSLSLSSWSEYHSYEIHEKSIQRYGTEIVVEAIINDMTFFGVTRKQHNSKCQSVTRSLLKASEADPSTFIPGEQVFADLNEKLGLPPREEETEEQKAAEHQAFMTIQRENCGELDLLEVPYRKK